MSIEDTPIAGLLRINQELHQDDRGWFVENYQQQKLLGKDFPDFVPVQNNISYNKKKGSTRGMHAEPWDKYVSIAYGKSFVAWVDLRMGKGFGAVHSQTIEPGVAYFVPRGVANGYQSLVDDTVYTYLVNAHWSPDAQYQALSIHDASLAIDWPIAASNMIVSDKDMLNPDLKNITPMEF